MKKSSKPDNTIFSKPLSKEMSVKSLKFFRSSTTKRRTFKMFGKLNGSHLLMANVVKHEY